MLQQVQGDADVTDGSFVEASTSDAAKPSNMTGMCVPLKASLHPDILVVSPGFNHSV